MKKLQNVFLFGIVGTGIGSAAMALSYLIGKADTIAVKDMLLWLAASFLIGLVSRIMFTDRLPLPALTAIHLVLTFAIVLVTNLILGNIDSAAEFLKGVLPGFIIIYVIVYAIVFLSTKINEKEINKQLSK